LLVHTEEPIDITDRYYRFDIKLPAQEKYVFNVREKITDEETKEIANVELEEVTGWKDILDKETFEKIVQVKELQKETARMGLQIYEKESEVREIIETQRRLRENIQALAGSVEQKKYIQELSREEDKLNGLQAALKDNRKEKKQMEKNINEKIQCITYTREFNPDEATNDIDDDDSKPKGKDEEKSKSLDDIPSPKLKFEFSLFK